MSTTKPIYLKVGRNGTSIYYYKGFLYYEDIRNTLILRCKNKISKRCPAVLYLDFEGNVVGEKSTEHCDWCRH